jgi:hypothetical protein
MIIYHATGKISIPSSIIILFPRESWWIYL